MVPPMLTPITIQHGLDEQWLLHYDEYVRLAYRKISAYLTIQEQAEFWSKANVISGNQAGHPASTTPTITDVALRRIYEKFRMASPSELLYFAVFTSEEEIEAYFAS
jgi:hypothetical protein